MLHKPQSFIAVYFLAALCSFVMSSYSHAKSSDESLTPINLQLRWFHQFQFAGYYVAKELGYYEESGLDVKITEGAPGIDPVEEVISGRAHFGVDNSGLAWARSENKPVKAVAAIFQKSAIRFIVLGEEQVTPLSLQGEKVMLLPDYGSLVLITLLKQENLLGKVERIDSSHNIEDLINKNTFAFNGYASNEPYILENKGIPYTQIDPADYGIKLYSDVLFTNDSLSINNPKIVDDFKSATLRGWKYALDHPEETIRIVKRYAPSKSNSHLRFEANIVREHTIADYVEIGHMSHDRWNKVQDHLISIGLITTNNSIDIDDLLHEPYSAPINWRDSLEYLAILALLIAGLFLVIFVYYRRSQELHTQVIEAKSTEEKLFKAATHDHLTGLPNRMLLFDRLEIALEDTKRTGTNCVVAFIDLDRFKYVNDHFGHHIGDDLLKKIATRMNSEIRSSATLARYGGDEFVFLGKGLNKEQAGQVGHRLIEAVNFAARDIEIDEKISASIGMIIIDNAENITASSVLKMADSNMYAQKMLSKGGVNIEVIE